MIAFESTLGVMSGIFSSFGRPGLSGHGDNQFFEINPNRPPGPA
jgi:hypothetical protein